MKILTLLLALAAFSVLLVACGEADSTPINPAAAQGPQPKSTSLPSPPSAEGPGAQLGDHWHAFIRMEVCGRNIALPASAGGVHSHGDGLIHIHPQDASEASVRANLGSFFNSFPYDIDTDHIRTPDGELFQNGDTCPGSLPPGRVQITVNGKDLTEIFRSHILQDGDDIEVFFK